MSVPNFGHRLLESHSRTVGQSRSEGIAPVINFNVWLIRPFNGSSKEQETNVTNDFAREGESSS